MKSVRDKELEERIRRLEEKVEVLLEKVDFDEQGEIDDAWIRDKIVDYLAHPLSSRRRKTAHSMTIVKDVEEAILLSVIRSYSNRPKTLNEFLKGFLDYYEEYSLAINGAARKDLKELWTGEEYELLKVKKQEEKRDWRDELA